MKKRIFYAGGVLAAILLAVAGVYGYLYASTPSHIRHPEFEHYHFRTQIVVDGKAVDLSKDKFQNEAPGTCTTDPGGTPVDFHDHMDQMTHIHWKGLTGGEFLKYFGWNLIGGSDGSLGRRYDDGFMSMHSVSRFGDLLPDVPEGSNFYVYVGDKDGYKQKSWDDFLHRDLEDFFGKKSNLNQGEQTSSLEDLFFPKAYAHGGMVDDHDERKTGKTKKTEEELTRINNLVGNVVIFVQKDEPTKEQIQRRFDNLVPLRDSICGG
ncbi:MAG TPA: hypothetical protein VFX84_00250 [Candidatus Saccharimonadales bacterium]|nr:hypothetical protein [Candidatus Saccharimonadales bacterium]